MYREPLFQDQPSRKRLCHANHTGRAAETSPQTPGHTSDPWRAPSAAPATQITPAERRPTDLESTKRCACQANHTSRAAATHGRQGIHPAPATQITSAERRRPSDARAYIQSSTKRCLPRKSQQQSGGDPLTPGTPWRAPSAAPARKKHTSRAAATHGRQGVHPTRWRAPSAAPAKQITPAERRRPTDARAYILRLPRKSHQQSGGDPRTPGRTSRAAPSAVCHANHTSRVAATHGRQGPLGEHQALRLHVKITPAERRRPTDARRQGIHPTRWRAPSAAPATQITPAERRRPMDARCPTPWRAPSAAPATQITPAERRRPMDGRAYIRPLGEHQALRLPRKSHQQSGGDPRTPGRTSDPLQSTMRCACHANHTSRAAATHGRQGCACHANHTSRAAATHGRQGIHPALATQITPAERRRPTDARAYIQSTNRCACHANHTSRAAATQPTPARAPSAGWRWLVVVDVVGSCCWWMLLVDVVGWWLLLVVVFGWWSRLRCFLKLLTIPHLIVFDAQLPSALVIWLLLCLADQSPKLSLKGRVCS